MPLHENSPECSVGFDYDAVDGIADRPPNEKPITHDDLLEFGRKICRFVRGDERARFTIDCMFLALGDEDAAQFETMTSVAEKHGITKAAVSKRTRELRAQLHLSINANNKSASAVEKYKHNRSPIRLTGPS
jgi:hypothetical protein